MLNGGSHTWTLNGYQGFVSAAAADPVASASAPSTAKPIVFVDCVMPLSPSVGSQLDLVGTAVISSLAAGSIGACAAVCAAGRWTFAQVSLIVNSEIGR